MRTTPVTCRWCAGSGRVRCSACRGLGKRLRVFAAPEHKEEPCDFCGGEGSRKCTWCDGTGKQTQYVIEPLEIKSDTPNIFTKNSMVSPFEHPTRVPLHSDGSQTARTTRSGVPGGDPLLDLAIVVDVVGLVLFWFIVGTERLLVGAACFFLVGGWVAMKASRLLPKGDIGGSERVRLIAAVGVGICIGALAAYLVVFTPEGQQLTTWVRDGTSNLIWVLSGSLLAVGLLEAVTRVLEAWISKPKN
jgi:hypothetical protein